MYYSEFGILPQTVQQQRNLIHLFPAVRHSRDGENARNIRDTFVWYETTQTHNRENIFPTVGPYLRIGF